MPLSSFIFCRVAGWRTTWKWRRLDLLLLTCLIYIKISLVSSFSFFYLRFFIHNCFGFDETKVTKGKFEELWPVLRTRLNFQTAPTKMLIWNLQIKIQ